MDPALWEFLRRSTDRDGREVEAIIRLDRPQADVVGVRIVSRFGCIATCRLRKDSILDVRRNDHVISLKAARPLGPEHERQAGDLAGELSRPDGDSRRPSGLRLTGAGVTVGFVDWGCDFDHPNFKRPDGSTRLRALWDQRGLAARSSPQPYGYGTVHDRWQINRALRTADPYAALGYHPGDADRDASGAHGTHVMDIAAGNGLAGGPSGVAPEADLVFVHLADRGTSGLANLGDSVRILEAADFIARTAGPRPWVINISVGRHGGPHDGCTLAELAFDSLLKAAPGRFIVQSAGNYFGSRTHASGLLDAGQVRSLTMMTHEADVTPNELEVWYSGEDELDVQVTSPTGQQTRWVPLSEQADVTEDDRVVGRIYHRDCDPNNHDNHIDLFLDPWAPAGPWSVSLRGIRIRHGVFHAWIERDEACADCQARFVEADADSACTTGTIANAYLPLVVGAYDAHSPTRAVAAFSSAGPTRDGRSRPDLVAPGMQILAARSAPPGSVSSLGLLTIKSGTSMAAPHVTGTVALCLQSAPSPLAAGEIRELLLRTAGPLTEAEPSPRYGRGYLDVTNAAAAVSALGRRATSRRPIRSAGAWRPRRDLKETEMNPELNDAILACLSPDILYRELLYRQGGPVSAWIDATFEVIARPGESPRTQPETGDVLFRVALDEPRLGHLAVLSDSGLRPRSSLDPDRSERGGPGLYATVIEGGAFPHTHSDRYARRILDQAGHMPPGQVLLRPKPPPGPQEGPGSDIPGATLAEAQSPASDRETQSAMATRMTTPQSHGANIAVSPEQTAHPPTTAVSKAAAPVNIYARFEVYNLTTRTFEPLPAGVTVELRDYDPISPDDTEATATTDAQGSVHFTFPDPASVKNSDLYFMILTAGRSHAGHTLPAEWSTKGWTAKDGSPGYFENFNGSQLGDASTPLIYRIGLDFHGRLRYEDAVPGGKAEHDAPPGISFGLHNARGFFMGNSTTALRRTAATGEVHGVTFDFAAGEDLYWGVNFEILDPTISLPRAIAPPVATSLTEAPPQDAPTDFSTSFGIGYSFFPYTAISNNRTSIGSDQSPVVFTLKHNTYNVALFCLKTLRELSVFLWHMTSAFWDGIANLNFDLAALVGTWSWPVGEVNIHIDDHWDRGVIIHELSHQVMWRESGFTSKSVAWLAASRRLHLSHAVDSLVNPEHALIEGWADYMECLFAKPSTYPLTTLEDHTDLFHSWGLGESSEGAFANALWDVTRDLVMPSSVHTTKPSAIPEAWDGNVNVTAPWILDQQAQIRFLTMIWEPMEDLAKISSKSTTMFIERMRVRNPDAWHRIRRRLQKWNLAIAVPTVSSVTPAAGPVAGGQTVTITGTNFVEGMLVTIGGAMATDVNVTSSTSLEAVTPSGPGPLDVDLRVKIDLVSIAGRSLTGTLPLGYSYR